MSTYRLQRDTLIDAILRGSAAQSTLAFPKSTKGKEPMVQKKLQFDLAKTQKSLYQAKLPFKRTPEARQTQLERVRCIVTNKLSMSRSLWRPAAAIMQ